MISVIHLIHLCVEDVSSFRNETNNTKMHCIMHLTIIFFIHNSTHPNQNRRISRCCKGSVLKKARVWHELTASVILNRPLMIFTLSI